MTSYSISRNAGAARMEPADDAGRRVRRAAKAALLCAAMLTGALHAQEISPAEKMLFQTDHLHNLAGAKALRYGYVHKEAAGPGFDDQVRVEVNGKGSDGSAAVSTQFLSGERQVTLPPVSNAQGNPALLGFLERDINEMKRLTGGSTSYFRKRIRLALAEAASVEPVSVSYGGRQVEGKQIAIQPYLNDPMQEKMKKYLTKRYVFILSDKIPGSVYQVRSTVPGDQQGDRKNDAALIEETMTVAGANGAS
jgi:hypothetical protein